MGSAEKCAKHRGLGINTQKCLYERVIVSMAETLGMRSTGRRKKYS